MTTKLTLRLDERLISKAKLLAARSGKSVSQIVADYFAAMDADEDIPGTEISSRVRSLRGAFKGSTVTEEEHRRYLDEKYRGRSASISARSSLLERTSRLSRVEQFGLWASAAFREAAP